MAVKERGILMHARSIRGILDGRKTQTRRIIKKQPPTGWDRHCWFHAPIYGFTWESELAREWHKVRCPYISSDELIGNRLWVRETWCIHDPSLGMGETAQPYPEAPTMAPDYWRQKLRFRADGEFAPDEHDLKWKPGIHMPRWVCRMVLEITNIRVERVQDISEGDCKVEGIRTECLPPDPDNFHPPGSYGYISGKHPEGAGPIWPRPQGAFAELWDDTNGKGAWERNDWVWVIGFRRMA